MIIVQKQISIQTNRHRREVNFKFENYVDLFLKSHKLNKLNKLSSKLAQQNAESFEIKKKIENAFELKFFNFMKIHSIFFSDKFRKTDIDSLNEQIFNSSSFIEIDDENEWTVKKVLSSWMSRNKLQYKIKWIEFDRNEIWYSTWNFTSSSHLIWNFDKVNLRTKRSSKRLSKWINVWKREIDERCVKWRLKSMKTRFILFERVMFEFNFEGMTRRMKWQNFSFIYFYSSSLRNWVTWRNFSTIFFLLSFIKTFVIHWSIDNFRQL